MLEGKATNQKIFHSFSTTNSLIHFLLFSDHLSVITKHPTLAKYFLTLQIIIAAFILLISALMFLRTRNFKDRDNPHWSGSLVSSHVTIVKILSPLFREKNNYSFTLKMY